MVQAPLSWPNLHTSILNKQISLKAKTNRLFPILPQKLLKGYKFFFLQAERKIRKEKLSFKFWYLRYRKTYWKDGIPIGYGGIPIACITWVRNSKSPYRLGITGWMASSALLSVFCSCLQQWDIFPQAAQGREESFLHRDFSWATRCSQIKSMSHTVTTRKVRHVVTFSHDDLDSIHARANVPRRRWKPGYVGEEINHMGFF